MIVVTILDGLEKKKGSRTPVKASSSHSPINIAKIASCPKRTMTLSFRIFFK